MSAVVTVEIRCDHFGCDEYIEGRDNGTARRIAKRRGWLVAAKRGRGFHDYCPEHRTNARFYG